MIITKRRPTSNGRPISFLSWGQFCQVGKGLSTWLGLKATKTLARMRFVAVVILKSINNQTVDIFFCAHWCFLLSLPPKRTDEIHLKVGSRKSGYRVGNVESLSKRIGVSKTINRLQSELVYSRRGGLVSRTTLSPPPNDCADEPAVITGRVVKRERPLL